MIKVKGILEVWKKVFGNLRYFVFGVITFFLFYLLNVLLANINNIRSFYSVLEFPEFMSFLFSLVIEFRKTIVFSSFISLIFIGLLFGFLISLILFKVSSNIKKKGSGFLGGLGLFLGIFAPGCAACGIGLVSALGLSAGFLSIFPYKGIELSILSIIILAFAIFKTSKDLTTCDICKVNLKNKDL